ncbi:MAG: tetratricopeptide repeat protein [Firmicutes bacterium]|nr:tetratricopeptide repeat protein [Bacillota bacterium]
MDEKLMFALLEIEKTKDAEAIRSAYRERLQYTHPEDDAEGFKRLREAYEGALKYAETPEEGEEKQTDTTPSGLWMERVREVYFSLPKRLDEKEWEKLLQDDVCLSLDEGENAKWKLFSFLTGHYQLPVRVYQLFERVFHIKQDAGSFKEHFPVNFVDFVLRKIDDTDDRTDFDYAGFRGADDADYDGFIREYYNLSEQNARRDGRAAWQTVQTMEHLGIFHPQFETQKAYALMLLDRKEDALALIRPLSEQYKDNIHVQVIGGEILYECGAHEEAEKQLSPYCDRNYYQAEKYLSFCEEEKGNLAKAIRHCSAAMQNQNGKELEEYAHDLDRQFLEKYEKEPQVLIETEFECLLDVLGRNEREQESLGLMEQRPDLTKEIRNYQGFRISFNYHLKRYQETIRGCRSWREELAESEAEDKLYYETKSYLWEGAAFYQLGAAGEQNAYHKAKEAYTEAARLTPDRLDIRQNILIMQIVLKEWEDAVRLADEMIAIDAGWFPAYVQKQKACKELHRDQEVVDCFYAAHKLYKGMADIYENAAEVFINYRQYKDAAHILQLAKEAETDSIMLDILKLRNLRLEERSYLTELEHQNRRSDFRLNKELTNLIREVKTKYKQNPANDEQMCSLFMELGAAECSRVHPKEAVRCFRRALKYEDRDACHYWFADALMDMKDTDGALSEYHKYEERVNISERYCITVAYRMRSAERREDAISYFKKALELNPENREANGEIANLYRLIMWNTGNRYYGEIAMPYMDRQLELTPDSALNVRRKALLLSIMGRAEESLAYFDKSLALKESHYSYAGKGKALRNLGRYEEALVYLQKAIDAAGSGGPESVAYGDGACCLCRMGRFQEAEDWFRQGIERFKDNPDNWFYDTLIWMYKKLGEVEKARAVDREKLEVGLADREDYEFANLSYDWLSGKKGEESYTERAKRLAEQYDSGNAWSALADYLLYENNASAALSAALTAYKKVKAKGDWDGEILYTLMECCRLLGDQEKASHYADEFYQEIEKAYNYNKEKSAVEQYLDDISAGVENAYQLAKCEIAKGNLEKAEEYLKWMCSRPMCSKCSHETCIRLPEIQGFLHEARGETEEALACYRRVLALFRADMDLIHRIQRLEEMTSS